MLAGIFHRRLFGKLGDRKQASLLLPDAGGAAEALNLLLRGFEQASYNFV